MTDRGRGHQADEHRNVFRRFQARFGARRSAARSETAGSEPFEPGRDPRSLGAALGELVRDNGWSADLAKAELFLDWADAVGPATAQHTAPTAIADGVLLVRCDSTAWATQLGLMRSKLLTVLAERFPEAGIESLRIIGPDVPSFKRGPRSVPGRGPRDTFG